ncbi:hypothetical protein [Teichococcus coralli]|nr:hypothetical protein [Pseudoroseomonas coralli]
MMPPPSRHRAAILRPGPATRCRATRPAPPAHALHGLPEAERGAAEPAR